MEYSLKISDIMDKNSHFATAKNLQHKSDISNANNDDINEGKRNDLVRFLYRWRCNANDVNKKQNIRRMQCRILHCINILYTNLVFKKSNTKTELAIYILITK